MTYHFNSSTWRLISVLLYDKLNIYMADHTQRACRAVKHIAKSFIRMEPTQIEINSHLGV